MRKISLTFALLFTLCFFNAQAQPPNPGGSPSGGGNGPLGGGAPIGSGTLLLVSLAAVYGARKYHAFIKKEELEE
jgi:hypothetical protein